MQDAGQAGPRAERDIVDLTRETDEDAVPPPSPLEVAGDYRAEADADADADDPSPSTSEWETDSETGSDASANAAPAPGPAPALGPVLGNREDAGGAETGAGRGEGGPTLAEAIRELRELKEQIDALEADMVPEFDALRQMIRRLRFATRMHARDSPSGYTTGDVAFFSSMRRRFVQSWEDEREFLLRCEPYHLVFLANLLDFPAMRDRGDAMLGPDPTRDDNDDDRRER